MKKKVFYGVFLGLFLVICLTLSVGTWIAGPSRAGANEQLSKPPELRGEDGWNDHFLGDTARWMGDHFALRQELISMDHLLTGAVFGVSGSDSVILGKDGWLFYSSTLDDYTGLAPMTEREIYSAARNLYLMQSRCRDFAFLIAPNKNSLYPHFMPPTGVRAREHDAQRLMEKLTEMGVSYIDLFSAFEKEPVLYYATDSHWNPRGAALAADLINAEFFVESHYYAGPFRTEVYTGDLYTMLYPAFSGAEEAPVYDGTLDFSYEGKATQPDSITLKTASDRDSSILVYRDSFGNLLYPYLADSYGSARFSRSTAYDLTGGEDHVLVELVERNLRYLLTYVPVSDSPTVDTVLPGTEGLAQITAEPKAKAPEGLILWRGTVETDPESPVYVACGDTVYEAYLMKDNGYAVYLPEEAAPDMLGYFCGGQLESKQLERNKA